MGVFKRLDHVSIGVKDLEKAKTFFHDVLGCEPMKDLGSDKEDGFDWVTYNLGGKKIELVAPIVAGEGGVGRYIEKAGEGFHHISVSVDDVEKSARFFKSKGIRVIGEHFESKGWKHFYLHPEDTFGALIQVFEESEHTIDLAE